MLNHLDNYFFSQPEPYQSCMLFLRGFILKSDKNISEHFKFNIPFYHYKNKWFCYISVNKKKQLYIGIVHGNKVKHAKLVAEGRKQIKYFYINPSQDVDIKSLKQVMQQTLKLKLYT